MTKEFDARNERKSRSVCAAMAEAADTGKRVLSEREKCILDMWPRFEDGAYVWFGDGVKTHNGIVITVEAIEFSRGKVCVKDDEDGDFDTSMYAMHPLKRPAPKVLDADGVEIKVGDTVRSSMYGDNDFTVSRFVKNCKGETFVMVEKMWSGLPPLTVTHARPDSWERLEEDAAKHPCDYAEVVKGSKFNNCDDCPWWGECGGRSESELMARDIIRRAKKLAGEER